MTSRGGGEACESQGEDAERRGGNEKRRKKRRQEQHSRIARVTLTCFVLGRMQREDVL